jgi:hypothetical protein
MVVLLDERREDGSSLHMTADLDAGPGGEQAICLGCSSRPAHADTGCCFRTFRVRNSVLRLIPNMAVNSLTGSPCW